MSEKMIMSNSMRIYTCSCKTKAIKSKSKITKEGYPVFLCKRCMKEADLTEEDLEDSEKNSQVEIKGEVLRNTFRNKEDVCPCPDKQKIEDIIEDTVIIKQKDIPEHMANIDLTWLDIEIKKIKDKLEKRLKQ